MLELCVAHGWIDGRTCATHPLPKVQHGAQSGKASEVRLNQEGRMKALGFASLEAEGTNGIWGFVADVDCLGSTDDLRHFWAQYRGR
ncbi:MAG: hypothetical protein MK098_04965 [Marinovum sp.]|nr:hypothetical protein [Marinovum sp.]